MIRARHRQGNRRRGQTLVEYAYILAFISAIAIAVMISLNSHVKGAFKPTYSVLSSAQASG